MQISPGKYRGLQRLSDDAGLFKMVAVDQRNPIFGPIKRIRGTAEAPYADVAAVKDLLTRALAPKSSAILLDPIYSFPRALPFVGQRPGLILTYEHSVLEETPGGVKSRPIPGWSVEKIRLGGADALKVLVHYRADAAPEVRKHQLAFVRAAGEACRKFDLVHLTEILIYALPGEAPGYATAHRARLVQEAVDDFLDPTLLIDIYKLEPPSALQAVPDPNGKEAAAVQSLYDRLAAKLPRPWVLLSAGASAEDFHRSLAYAYRTGASGYLCGRAIWQSAFGHFPDLAAMAAALQAESVPFLDKINEMTERSATPWQKHPGFKDEISFAHAGKSFPEHYAA
jgi:tagatose 1,6-diphosphate aldolase